MSPEIVVGAFLMTLSFLALGIGSVSLERFRILGLMVLIFLSTGVLFNAGAILLLLWKAKGALYSFRGALGIFAFFLMAVNTGWVWREYAVRGVDGAVCVRLVKYTKMSFAVWVLSYISGMILLIWM